MDVEKEKGDRKSLNREEAHNQLSGAWLSFWLSGQTSFDTETRNRAVLGVLERLSEFDRKYFLNEEIDEEPKLAKIREMTKEVVARTGKKNTPSAGERLHIRREKATKRRGTDPKRIH